MGENDAPDVATPFHGVPTEKKMSIRQTFQTNCGTEFPSLREVEIGISSQQDLRGPVAAKPP